MSYNIGLVLENIALEIITLGVCTASDTISSETFWPKCQSARSFDVIEVYLYLSLANMALEILRGGESKANVTISRD